MGILAPDPGLVFWTSFSFITLLIILRRYAWKPILRALKVREEYIEFAIKDAAHAREEVQKLSETRKQMIESTRLERESLIREARETKEEIVREARVEAENEAERIISKGRDKILRERREALANMKQQIGLMSFQIAEKILKGELKNDEKQKSVINSYLDEVNFN